MMKLSEIKYFADDDKCCGIKQYIPLKAAYLYIPKIINTLNTYTMGKPVTITTYREAQIQNPFLISNGMKSITSKITKISNCVR